jgi:hypothetical protein
MLWRLGTGEIGGKAMGLEFFRSRVGLDDWQARFAPHRLLFADTAVLRTDLFAEFVEERGLLETFDMEEDADVRERFLSERLTRRLRSALERYVEKKKFPIAVRSSARNEDALNHPFAGLYTTVLLPNNHEDPGVRLRQLESAVKLVYASTFMKNPKHYMRSHNLSIENERMAVILQELVGGAHGRHFFPHVAGVAQSLNFFPVSYLKPEHGIALLVMGLGKAAVDGKFAMRFSPAYPLVRPQFQQIGEIMRSRQRELFALDLEKNGIDIGSEDDTLELIPVRDVIDNDIIPYIASTYIPSERVIYQGVRKEGTVILTFDRLLSSELVPLPEILKWLLEKNEEWWNVPVDLEFAVNFQFHGSRATADFYPLQARPLVAHSTADEVDLPENVEPGRVVVRSGQAMGNGSLDGIRHIIYVPLQALDPAKSTKLASQVGMLSRRLMEQGHTFMLVGPGRWGTTNPYLGIPVAYAHIEGARVIVEVTWEELMVEPSQGTHFFLNIATGSVMYLSVDMTREGSVFNREWLDGQADAGGQSDVRLIELDAPLRVKVDGRKIEGLVYRDRD